MADVKVDNPTDISGAYDAHMDPTLRNAEERGSDVDYSDDKGSDDSSRVANSESDGVGGANWAVNRTQGVAKSAGESLSKRLLGGVRKSGPVTAVVGVLVGLGIGASMFFSPSMLLIHIKEVIVSRFNIQSSALEVRTNKILAKKLASVGTPGCGATSILQKCKYSKMSNKMLTKLKEQGFVPVDANGKEMNIKDGWGSDRPSGFKVPDDLRTGSLVSKEGILEAKNFTKFLSDNPAAAGAFRKVFNPVWSSFWDSTFMTKFLGSKGLDKSSKVSGEDEDGVRQSFDDDVDGKEKAKVEVGASGTDGENSDTTKASQTNADQANSLIDGAGTSSADDVANSLDSIGKEASASTGKVSGGVLLIANLYCMARSTGAIAKAVRVAQMTQIIAYGMLFLQAADEIKAGHGSPAKAAFFGTALTTVLVDTATNTVKKKAATDSVGMKYALLKDSGATSTTSDYTKYLPGGGIVSALQTFANAISGQGEAKKELDMFCEAINSDAAQVGQLLLDFTPVGIAMTAVGLVISKFSGTILAPIIGMLAGKVVDSTLQAEDLGNAAAVGMVQTVAEGANAGAMMPMTTSQTSAYLKLHAETQLADARIDQATLSPFDVSSPNTFLGSIMTQLIPYYGSMQTVTGVFSSITSVVGSSLSSIVSPKSGALDDADIGGCPMDTGSVATGKLCNAWYAIPTEYLNIDPEENQATLESQGQLSADGTPVEGSDLAKYLETCATGNGSATDDECIINDEQHARYALANVDRRIQRNMDGEDVVATSSTGGSSTAVDDTTTPVVEGLPTGGVKDTAEGRKQAWQIAEQFVNDVNNKYNKNYKDISNYSLGYNRSSGTLGNSANGFGCFGASRCAQCYALSAWFLDKYTTEHIGTTSGSGDGVVAYLKKQGVPTGNEAKVYSIFSYGRAVDGSGAHTGVVVGIDGDYAITVENNYNFGGTLYINKRPKSGAEFRGTGDRTVFAYVNGILRDTPKKY